MLRTWATRVISLGGGGEQGAGCAGCIWVDIGVLLHCFASGYARRARRVTRNFGGEGLGNGELRAVVVGGSRIFDVRCAN